MPTKGTKRSGMSRRRRTSSSMIEDTGKGRGMAKRTRRTSTTSVMGREEIGTKRGVRSKRVSRMSARTVGGRKVTRKSTRTRASARI